GTAKADVADLVADAQGMPLVVSGLTYGAITLLAEEQEVDPHDRDAVTRLAESTRLRVDGDRVWADGKELTEGIFDADFADSLPVISAIPGVRQALVDQQRPLVGVGIVMAGRDIGTVVFPDADHMIS